LWFGAKIPDRLLHVARGKGLDRVESAISILSDGIAARVDQIVAGDKSLRLATGALSVMASARERIVSARATVSTAHRTYALACVLIWVVRGAAA
jgi:hypothetical protein